MARNTYESGWLGNKDPKTERGAAEQAVGFVDTEGCTECQQLSLGKDTGWGKVESRRSWPGNAAGEDAPGLGGPYGSLYRSERKIRVR